MRLSFLVRSAVVHLEKEWMMIHIPMCRSNKCSYFLTFHEIHTQQHTKYVLKTPSLQFIDLWHVWIKGYAVWSNLCKIIVKLSIDIFCSFAWLMMWFRSTWNKILSQLSSEALIQVYCLSSHCLKITQNVAFEFLNSGIFHQFLTY